MSERELIRHIDSLTRNLTILRAGILERAEDNKPASDKLVEQAEWIRALADDLARDAARVRRNAKKRPPSPK